MSLATYIDITVWIVIANAMIVFFTNSVLLILLGRNRSLYFLDRAVIANQIGVALLNLVWGSWWAVTRVKPEIWMNHRTLWVSAILISSVLSLVSAMVLLLAVVNERVLSRKLRERGDKPTGSLHDVRSFFRR